MKIVAGTKLGRYEIRSKLGEGGMGEVYLAEDNKLNRKVALKILPPDLAADGNRMKRFEQEAKAASALNHPNIITIHEIDHVADGHFIATEFIDGETLRQRLRSEPMTLNAALEVATQIASALAAAHDAGIIHRDIKPENVMVRRDGLVKVLDLGLAKLTEQAPRASVDKEAPTRAAMNTEPGVVMGTVLYMSPEQARGLVVDARTDVFSLGALIYEMVTGRLPFEGSNANEILASILSDKEPLPLARYAGDVPAELERIVAKALHKNRDERYQTSKDLLIDLRRLKEHLEFEARLERSASSDMRVRSTRVVERLTQPQSTAGWRTFVSSRGVGLALLAVIVLAGIGALVYAWHWKRTTAPSQTEIRSLAVLPLKSLDSDGDYLGLGIADAVIRRISQTGSVIVRPTSAVRRYLNEDTDALTAARQLGTDAVLEGSVQRANDRLRVSVNLLRTTDGMSVWTNNFDMQMTDVFTIEDTVAQQVATRLRLQLDPTQQARLTKRSTSNTTAYEFYVKAVYAFDLVLAGSGAEAKPRADATIGLLKQAIAADPNYALAHAQLAYVYATRATFIDPTDPAWAQRAREEIDRAQTLDPQLAENHLARSLLLWSAYDGWQIEEAIRELRLAQQADPNVGHANLGALYRHAGLEDLAARELQRALEIDPTSEFVKSLIVGMPAMTREYDEEFAAARKFFGQQKPSAEYLMAKGRLNEAQKTLEELSASEPDKPRLPQMRAVLFALKSDFHAAEAEIPTIFASTPRFDPNYHHATYNIACVYALEGKTGEAVKWLRETAATGFPCYPLFARDPYLNRIRQSPEFIQFLADMKAQNERFRREFAEGVS